MSATKAVRPILSRTPEEARRRVIKLYRAWYRQLPFIVHEYKGGRCNVTVPELHAKLREEFDKNKNLTDLRIIDLLIHRGQNELIEVAHLWKSDTHVMDYFRDNIPPKPDDFLSKFLRGHES